MKMNAFAGRMENKANQSQFQTTEGRSLPAGGGTDDGKRTMDDIRNPA